ncbi:MAG: hypothetical protein Q4G30_09425 [Actinomycetaceae bacterium]|nr:hypothetical protein [Actinomycetaceae bacterium]
MSRKTDFYPPKHIQDLLERPDRRGVYVIFEGGQALNAGTNHLSLITDDALVFNEPWCKVQHLIFDADMDTMNLAWADPSRPAMSFKKPETQWLPHFGEMSRERLAHTQVATVIDTLDDGTQLRATVRRDINGVLFSEVIALGVITPECEQRAATLENQVREMAGLD